MIIAHLFFTNLTSEWSITFIYFYFPPLFQAGVNVSHCVSFNPNTPAKELWRDLMEDGQLDSTEGEQFIVNF